MPTCIIKPQLLKPSFPRPNLFCNNALSIVPWLVQCLVIDMPAAIILSRPWSRMIGKYLLYWRLDVGGSLLMKETACCLHYHIYTVHYRWSDMRSVDCENLGFGFQHTFVNNSLWASDATWRQISGSTLAQVMAWCLTAPSHYLNQCWLIIIKVKWHSSEPKFTRDTSAINHWNKLDKNDVWNAEIPSAAERSVYGTNSKYIGAECPPLKLR